jgi:BASS family bile acid:Na+ symporter
LLWQQGTIDFLPILTLTIALQVFLSFSLSHFVFRKLLKIDLKHSIALTYSIGSKNNSFAMAIALTFFSPLAAIPSVIYLITQIIASSVMLKILERENQ